MLHSLRRHGGTPDSFERYVLLQVGPDLFFYQLMGDRLLEWLRRPDLVGVVDTFDGLLRLHAVFERENAGDRIRGEDEPGNEGQDDEEKAAHGLLIAQDPLTGPRC